MKIVIDNQINNIAGVFEPYSEVVYKPGYQITNNDLTHAHALIVRTRTRCNQTLLHNTQIEFIASATIGFDHIDTEYCIKNNIAWTNAPGCNSGAVTQYVFAAISTLAQKMKFRFCNTTIGIVGVGNIGNKVAEIAKKLGMNVLLNDPPRQRNENNTEFVELQHIVKNADIITLHVPLITTGTDNTFHLINENTFNELKPNCILINSSRGEVVDNQSLKQALKQRIITTAVLDVWENEPYIDTELLQLVKIATPHIAGYSVEGKVNATIACVRAVGKHFGFPMNDWKPTKMNKKSEPQKPIYKNGETIETSVYKAIKQFYDIETDDNSLRSDPSSFEKLRSNYSLRFETIVLPPNLDI